jgi:hypothetical protein
LGSTGAARKGNGFATGEPCTTQTRRVQIIELILLSAAFKVQIIKEAELAISTITVDSKLHSMSDSGTLSISVAKCDLFGIFDYRFW